MAEKTTQSELMRLLKEQIKARQDEVFGGLSPAERAEYDARTKRIHDLGIALRTKRAERTIAEEQRYQWNKSSETDNPKSDGRQPYRSRETDSANAFTDSLRSGRGTPRKNESEDASKK